MSKPVRMAMLVLAGAAVISVTHSLIAFNLTGDTRWPPGQINMEMQLGAAGGLIDGSPDWDACATAALDEWNAVLGPTGVSFNAVTGSTRTPTQLDGFNNVYFSDTIFGMAFPTNVLAVTSTSFFARTGVDEFADADVIFNNAEGFNCFREPKTLGSIPEGAGASDLRRVSTHEFGHVLGLDHPDDIGQAVDAIMNAFISAIDVLQLDDIQGALTLYGVAVTGIPFPARDQVLAFYLNLENEYRDTLGRQRNNLGNVNAEGSAVWLPEFLRYMLNGCSAAEATTRVLLNIATGAVQPVCGVVPSGVFNFPPRNLSLDFLNALDTYYRDELNETAPDSYIDLEGKAVWLEVYLGYRVNGCNNQDATDRVFQQIRTGVIAPACAT
jgi:hypothetical protein